MRTHAILPVKTFANAKQRLDDGLDAVTRRVIAQAMFSDVLVALRRAREIDEILVVTADDHAAQIAGGYGASVLVDQERGHNSAAAVGVLAASNAQAGRVLLIPGDCPLLDPAEVDALIRRSPAAAVVIVPDRHRTGTNALLLTPPDALKPSFGPDSCARHVATAEHDGSAAEVVEVPSLALDVDTPDDLETLHATLEATHGRAAHTRGALRQLWRSRT
ncbi:MAG: 2-phospho-L-lactate guanylyltransferase [Solirubrobacteraceae bacterium]|nr:2-phospho-L-lactate guanylyltransferase [Actinomycetota bacterium]